MKPMLQAAGQADNREIRIDAPFRPVQRAQETRHVDASHQRAACDYRRVAHEHRDRRYLIIDSIQGQSHYVDIGEDAQDYRKGSILRIATAPIKLRKADHAIASIAQDRSGRYSVDHHLAHDPLMTEDRAQAYVRRLEAMRRMIGKPDRQPDGSWIIGPDHLADAERY